MPWSERHNPALAAYALAALLALLELAVLWQALHPVVSDQYRAYYIDRTTTCLPQPVTGVYALGTELDFRSGGDDTRELRPCGWDGPAGDGVHAVGESSRLLFQVSQAQPLTLMLELAAVTLPGPAQQRVRVTAGGVVLGELLVTPGHIERFTLQVPVDAISAGALSIVLDYPYAISPAPRTANTHWRSVKLTAASLTLSESL